tara:strand:+ start:12749 stop:13123 length:375 start_codon:yes stop_codon:yes gene_type:complete
MSNFYKFELNSELNILYKNYYGSISIENIFSSWEHAFSNDVIPSDIKGFILDFRESTFDFKTERFIEIVDFYKRNIEFYRGKKVALISTNPSDLVVPILFNSKDKGYSSKSFSTQEAALDWILE